MDQQVKLLAAKLNDLASICNTHSGKRELTPECCPLPSAHTSWHVSTCTYIHTFTCVQTIIINNFKEESKEKGVLVMPCFPRILYILCFHSLFSTIPLDF